MIDDKSLAEQINKIIEDIWIQIERQERKIVNFKLNTQQYVLLNLIIGYPLSSPSELAKKMEISKSAISQQLLKLESEHFITKIQDPDDKRAYSIGLGEKGLNYKKELDSFFQHFFDKYYSQFSHEELTNMLLIFQKLKRLLEE
ncbi:MAG: MarR family transcriptional regulator [Syntrophomonadaceae bacterium]|nr:MarR family transcriptional regulator [Syntrophomonadaceae bacterium]